VRSGCQTSKYENGRGGITIGRLSSWPFRFCCGSGYAIRMLIPCYVVGM
jgi:hypothetical protein